MSPAFRRRSLGNCERVSDSNELDADLSILPEDVQPLVPLIKKYGVGDDVERGTRMSAATVDELRALLKTTRQPSWDTMDSYIDTHMERPGAPEQDVAIVLQDFMQAVAEARYEIEDRQRR
jgi:hypothetical protein